MPTIEIETTDLVGTALPTCGGWPPDVALVDASPIRVRFVPALFRDPVPTVALVRQVSIDDRCVAQAVIWYAHRAEVEEAERWHDWLGRQSSDLARWGRHVGLFGCNGMTAIVEAGVAAHEAERQAEAAELARRMAKAERKEERERELAKRIESYLSEKDGQFGLTLWRGGGKSEFWAIMFRTRADRERFRDWWRWQRHRFEEWADFLEGRTALQLERLVLKEMLETERRVKKDGLSAGGTRPLRFWRGEE